MMGRFGKLGWLKRPSARDREVVRRTLFQMGIHDLSQRPIGELSGGQQQRVFLSRALAQEPHILLMDEPFTGVDVSTQETVLEVLQQLKREQVTVMISTHDLNLAASRFEQVLLIKKRLVAYGPPEDALTAKTLSQAFGGQVFRLPDGTTLVDECSPAEDEEIIQTEHIHVHRRQE
jgi:ABC-type Mn2+/Zn2+ transport system ATPase subunit